MFSLLDAKYKKRSVYLLKLDLLFKINFLIFSEFFEPPGSLSLTKLIFFSLNDLLHSQCVNFFQNLLYLQR